MIRITWLRRWLPAVLLALALPALAQTFDLTWYTIDGGGIMVSTGGDFQLGGAIGQPDAHIPPTMTGGSFELTGGFWPVTLPVCTSFVPIDFDHDCDVDHDDFVAFAACVSGPDVPRLPACATSDLDGDNDVDQSDFGIFQRCYSGKDKPANPNCMD